VVKVYIAGPMTGIPDYNFPAFDAAAARLRDAGHDVVNPAWNGVPLDAPRADHLRVDIRNLIECDAVAVLPGWDRSQGARLEVRIASDLGLTVMDVPA